MKALSTKALRTAHALRYPTYKCLSLQRMLGPALGSVMMGAGNLYSLGLDTLHGSGSLSLMTAHIVTHVVIVVPMGQRNGLA